MPPTFTSLGSSGSLNDFGASTTPLVSATDASQLTSMPPANLVVCILWRSLVITNYLCLEPFVLMIFRRIWEVSCFLYDLGFSTDSKPKMFFVVESMHLFYLSNISLNMETAEHYFHFLPPLPFRGIKLGNDITNGFPRYTGNSTSPKVNDLDHGEL